MPSDRNSLLAVYSLIEETTFFLETTPGLPLNRSGCCRENLREALALLDNLLKSQKTTTRGHHRPAPTPSNK